MRPDALVRVDLTEREVRSLARAATLVADVLRPELFWREGSLSESPLVTAYQVLVASCERAGVDLGLGVRGSQGAPRDVRSPDSRPLTR